MRSVKFRTTEGSVYEIEFNQDNGISAPGGRVRRLEGENQSVITEEWRPFAECRISQFGQVAFFWDDDGDDDAVAVTITPPVVAATNPETGEWMCRPST